jgi:hypothetical protein
VFPVDDKVRVKKEVLESVFADVSRLGFALKASKDSFIRAANGISDVFQLVFLDGKPGWRIQPNIGVRIEKVEEIFHRTSGFDSKLQQDTVTVGGGVGNILSGDNRSCEFGVVSESEVPAVSKEVGRVFTEIALPYFERFHSLSAIDAELNGKPTERTPNGRAPYLRCATGVIVAKLIGRPNYDELVNIYTEFLRQSDRGFYLKRFQSLVESLQGV